MTRLHDACEQLAQIEDVRRHELAPALRAHAAGCVHCARALDALERRIEVARGVGSQPLAAARSELLRARLLDSARRAPRETASRRPFIGGMVGVAAVLGLVFWAGQGARDGTASASSASSATGAADAGTMAATPTMHGTVRASAGAHFTRVSDEPDEIVRLVEGSITVSVTPLGVGERFRVIVGDAEVEVRGTAFDVAAADDHLAAVHVFHGRVEVRVDGHDPLVLEADDRWTRPTDEAADAVRDESERAIHEAFVTDARRSSVRAPRARASSARHAVSAPLAPAVVARDDGWSAAAGFETGWNALGAGDPERAAAAFGEVVDRAPQDALAEDASFWRGVALARAARPADAQEALAAFVRDYPSSLRANEAAVMLGWLLLEHGRSDEAGVMFARGAHDPTERVRASAERGLAAIGGDAPTR